MASDAIAAANGRWPEILAALAGLSDAELSDRHQPCPLCGGTDRYRFDDKDGSGSWFCNQCGGKDQRGGAGSGMDLLMRRQGWSFVEAARQVEAFLGLVPDGQDTRSGHSSNRSGKPWRMPEKPPADAPPPPLNRGATAQWAYRNGAGEVLFWIQRIRLRSGSKAFLHRVWLDGDWHRPSRRDAFTCDWPSPRPLYGLPGLGQRPEAPVLVVEGEGTADAAARLFPDHVVLTWANGSKAIAKADWTPLAGRSVALWPDADAAGVEAMDSLAALLHPLDCQLHWWPCRRTWPRAGTWLMPTGRPGRPRGSWRKQPSHGHPQRRVPMAATTPRQRRRHPGRQRPSSAWASMRMRTSTNPPAPAR